MAQKEPGRMSGALERAVAETPPGTETFLAIVLNHALEAEANFLGLYDAAIGKLQDEAARERLREFRGDHARHVLEIRGVLDQMGAPILAQERPTPVAIGLAARLERTQTDDELMLEFASSEDFSRNLYEWLGMLVVPEPIQRVAQKARDDEERHYRWAATRAGIEASASRM